MCVTWAQVASYAVTILALLTVIACCILVDRDAKERRR